MDIRSRAHCLAMFGTLTSKDGRDSANIGHLTTCLADIYWLYFKADAAQLQITTEQRGFYRTGD